MPANDTSPSLTHALAESVSHRGLSLAHGPTQTVQGADLVPVALVTYGFGASDDSSQWGVGGGGGGVVIPLGAYVKGRDGLRFRPNTILVLALLAPVLTVAVRALTARSRPGRSGGRGA